MPGLSHLPAPLYSRVSLPRLLDDESSATLRVEKKTALGGLQVMLAADAPCEVGYEAVLYHPPGVLLASRPPPALDLTKQASATPSERIDKALFTPTVALSSLPRETANFVKMWLHSQHPAWEIALTVQTFVQQRYRYDLDFLSDPAVQKALSRAPRRKGNRHLVALHACSDRSVIGAGICYELNLLVVELLRHLGIASMAATGWVFDGGVVSQPDHLFAVALLEGSNGQLITLPLDAAVSRGGAPERPMQRQRDMMQRMPTISAPSGVWQSPALSTEHDAEAPSAAELLSGEQTRMTRLGLDLLDCVQLVLQKSKAMSAGGGYRMAATQPAPDTIARSEALLERLRSTDNAGSFYTEEDVVDLHRAAVALLGHPSLVAGLLAVLHGDYGQAASLPAAIRDLARRDLVHVATVSRYQVTPSR
jgi:hypothetical protein